MSEVELRWGLSGRSSAELREMFIDWWFRPVSRVLFADHPDVESVVLGFAQYWNDEANDAVHALVRTSAVRDPIWEDVAVSRYEPPEFPEWDQDAEPFDAWMAREEAAESAWYEQQAREEARIEAAGNEVTAGRSTYFDNGSFIAAFASYCVEGANQGQAVREAYRPYAIARRAPDGEVGIEVVGVVHQPWREDEMLWSYVLWRFGDGDVERAIVLGHRALGARRRGEAVDVEALERAVAEHEGDLAALVGRRR
jgi:hypothetical protein